MGDYMAKRTVMFWNCYWWWKIGSCLWDWVETSSFLVVRRLGKFIFSCCP